MHIRRAKAPDLETVQQIVHETVRAVYPHYYPAGAVDFFLRHHRTEAIRTDIREGRVYLCIGAEGETVGTVTVWGKEICRLFVLPQYQGRGYGSALLDFAEAEIAKEFDEAVLDASMPAKPLYKKRGYQETAFHAIPAGEDFLCCDEMRRQLRPKKEDGA